MLFSLMGTTTPSRNALIRYAGNVVLLVSAIAVSAAILWAPNFYNLWRTNFSGLTYFDLVFYPLFLIALLNGIFYAVRLATWGETVHEQSVASALPMVSKVEISVPPSVPLRILIFIRSKHTLSDVSGTIKILTSHSSDVLAEKKIFGKQGTNARVAILSVSREKHNGRIVVDTDLDWRPVARYWGRDPNRNGGLAFDIIVRAKP